MSDERQKIMISLLENLIFPKYIEITLTESFGQTRPRMLENLVKKEQKKIEKIDKFFSYTQVQESLKRKGYAQKPQELIKPVNSSSDFMQIAMKSALYFRQGKEMLETAIDMPNFSSPVLLYYGFLQCVKGIILLEYDIDESLFFTQHGITNKKPKKTNPSTRVSQYLNGTIMPFGVFPVLIIQQSDLIKYSKKYETDMDYYFSGYCSISLEDIIDSRNIDVSKAFVGSWILSSIVRYNPIMWQELLSGTEDTIIKKILDFNRYTIPNEIINLIYPYLPYEPPNFV